VFVKTLISHKTKEYLDKLKETEQLSTYDAVIRN